MSETLPLLNVLALSKRFPVGGRFLGTDHWVTALKSVSFQVAAGETLAIAGGSGSGKTTLARILCRLLDANSGDFLWEGRPQGSFTRQAWARNVQMVFQDPYASLNPKLTVETQLIEVLRLMDPPLTSAGDDGHLSPPNSVIGGLSGRAVALLESVGLSGDALHRYPFQFSGGQRQRIAIARALALDPRLLIADEPLSALDVGTQDQIVALLDTLRKQRGLALMLITHDLLLAERMAQRVIVLQEGSVVEEGSAAQVLSAPQHAYTKALVEAVPR